MYNVAQNSDSHKNTGKETSSIGWEGSIHTHECEVIQIFENSYVQ